MAGRPKRRAMIDELERRTREEFGDEPEATHLDYVVRWVASGGTVIGLLADMGDVVSDVKRAMLMSYLELQYGAEVSRRMSEARIEGAHSMVEDAAEIVEGTKPYKDDIALSKLRADTKNFIASRWNRAVYGEPKAGVAVQVNLGSAFLDALRRQSERARLSSSPARAFVSDGAEQAALPAGSSAIVPAIADEAQDVTFEVLST
jgi:hypothetical protein